MAIVNRPHFGPRQVRTPAGIKPGNALTLVRGAKRYHDTIIVLSESYTDESGDLVFDLVYRKGLPNRACKVTYYLSDFGVVLYDSGWWNPTNCLLRTGRRCLTPEELEALRVN